MNQFAGVLTSASEAIASRLDTQAKGTAVVVYNPLTSRARMWWRRRSRSRAASRRRSASWARTARSARAAGGRGARSSSWRRSVGRVLRSMTFDRPGRRAVDAGDHELVAGERTGTGSRSTATATSPASSTRPREGDRCRPRSARVPDEMPKRWPAWNMDWEDQQAPPRAYVVGPARVRIVENGPARVALEITRESRRFTFVQTVRLAAGDAGDRVELANAIDWKPTGSLKASFPLTRPTRWPPTTGRSGRSDAATTTRRNTRSRRTSGSTSPTTAVLTASPCSPTASTGRTSPATTPCASRCSIRRPSTPRATPGSIPTRPRRIGGTTSSCTAWPATMGTAVARRRTGTPCGSTSRWWPSRAEPRRPPGQAILLAAGQRQPCARAGSQEGGRERRDRRTPGRAGRKVGAGRSRDLPLRGDRGPRDQRRGGALGPRPGGEGRPDRGPAALGNAQLRVEAGPAARKVAAPRSTPVALPYDLAVATLDGARSVGGFDASGNALAAEMVPAEIEYAGIRFDLAPRPAASRTPWWRAAGAAAAGGQVQPGLRAGRGDGW